MLCFTDCLNSHYGRTATAADPSSAPAAPSSSSFATAKRRSLERMPSISSTMSGISSHSDPSRASVLNEESQSVVDDSVGDDVDDDEESRRSSSMNSAFAKAYLQQDNDDLNGMGGSYSNILGKRKASKVQSLGQALGAQTSNSNHSSLLTSLPDASWGKRYAHAKSRLYILVHSIDGEALESPQCQQMLASLASCVSISVVAAVDKLNFQLLWSNEMLSQYRWVYAHAPTFEHYPMGISIGLTAGNKQLLTDPQAIEYIIKSLSDRHKEVLVELCTLTFQKRQARAGAGAGASSKSSSGNNCSAAHTAAPVVLGAAADGVSRTELGKRCFDRMIVKDPHALNQLLRELVEHRLVASVVDDKKVEHVCILLQDAVIKRLLNVN
jgi:hypothetical protein